VGIKDHRSVPRPKRSWVVNLRGIKKAPFGGVIAEREHPEIV
jgi:hypothetical protein